MLDEMLMASEYVLSAKTKEDENNLLFEISDSRVHFFDILGKDGGTDL